MTSIFNLNNETAPFTFALRDAIPFQGKIFDYNIEKKPDGGSTAVHVVRSAITITAYSAFILAGLVEKAVRTILSLIKKGVDKVLSQKQQENIKEKAGDVADKAKETWKEFFQRHFAPLFKRTS